jgi:hypothetical protein
MQEEFSARENFFAVGDNVTKRRVESATTARRFGGFY